jgi:hypothetical protein
MKKGKINVGKHEGWHEALPTSEESPRKARMRHGEKPNENGTRELDSQQKLIEIGYSPTVPLSEQQEERNNCNVLYKNLY